MIKLCKAVAVIAIALSLYGCSYNNRQTTVYMRSGKDLKLDASGASNTTNTGQESKADLSGAIKAAQDVVTGGLTDIFDKAKVVIPADPEAPAPESDAGKVEILP